MPDINLSWTPATTNANSIGQRAKAIARINGSVPNMTAVFIPANNMGVAVSNAIFRTDNFNIAYRFMVENICSSGGPTPNTNGIKEGIVFKCIPPNVKAGDTTATTYTARILKGAYTQIDGVNYPNSYSDIEAVEYSLYDATNSTLIQGPILINTITGTGNSEAFEHTFTGLTANTNYTPRFALLTTIDGITVRSDAAGYLGTKCVHPAIITTGGSTNCLEYKITNTTMGFVDVFFTKCDGTSGQVTMNPDTNVVRCALENTVIPQTGVTVLSNGACPTPTPICHNYTVDNSTPPQDGLVGTYSYTDCNTNVSHSGSLASGDSITFCAYDNSVVLSGANLSGINNGPCGP